MIRTLQNQLESLIEKHPYFEGIPIVVERKGDLQSQIDQATGSIGICIVIITPHGPLEKTPKGRLRLRHNLAVNAVENYALNETGKRATSAVKEIILAIHDQWNGLGPINDRANLNKIEALEYEVMPDPDGLTVYQVRATTLSTLRSIDNE